MSRGYLTLSAGPRNAKGERAVRLLVHLESPPPQCGEIRRLPALLTRRKTGRSLPLSCAGLGSARGPGSFFGEACLSPGEYRLTSPEAPGFGLDFVLPKEERSPVRVLCPHPGPRRSFTEALAAHAAGGERIAELKTCLWEACCRERLTATELPARNPKDMILFWPLAGTLEAVVGEMSVQAHKGSYAVVPPLYGNYLRRDRQEFPLRVRIITFSPDFLLDFCQMADLPGGLGAFSFRPGPHLPDKAFKAAYETLAETLRRTDALASTHEAYLAAHRFLLALVRRHAAGIGLPDTKAPSDREKEALDKAMTYFRTRYWEPCRIDRVAREAGVSVTGLRRIFRRCLNRSPNDFLQGIRVEAAKDLLRDPSRKLSDIAEAVGYMDVRNFRRVFKAHTRRQTGFFRPA